ncbi:hypothetical protein [Dysgonomonas sp. GY617]|uniref:hypothetical protein n=1 Tax=Dysgonomonas sp. GY617 TaxID=2780420 RepID=UPI001883D16D|nr:hypothetical protein [Dysgonomonas sp. GY617]MBF0578127.1 hypothetical protein [Dysgonomonas sp. GY617]
MRKIYLILLFVILYTANSQGQSTVYGTSTYRINVSGRVDGEGSDCGGSRTEGLQWIALIRQNDNNNILK